MSHALDFELENVLPFVQSLIPGLAANDGMRAIGLRRNGELVAGAVYEGFNGRNMWVHLAGLPGRCWLNRRFLQAGFHYPFVLCGVDRLSGYVNASNTDARKFDEHVGFHEEARLKGAAPDGGDVILYVMWRQDCRFLGAHHGQ
jgi:hypothetical protein